MPNVFYSEKADDIELTDLTYYIVHIQKILYFLGPLYLHMFYVVK